LIELLQKYGIIWLEDWGAACCKSEPVNC